VSTAYPHNCESELITFLIESCAPIQIDRFKVHTINTRPTFRAHILPSRVANFIAKQGEHTSAYITMLKTSLDDEDA
jgi:hypothetical protein